MRIAIPCIESSGRLYISPHFGRAQCFAIYDVDKNDSRMIELDKNPITISEHGSGRGRVIVERLLNKGINAVIVYSIGSGAFYKLRDAGIRVFLLDRIISIEEALKLFRDGILREAEGPVERLKQPKL